MLLQIGKKWLAKIPNKLPIAMRMPGTGPVWGFIVASRSIRSGRFRMFWRALEPLIPSITWPG